MRTLRSGLVSGGIALLGAASVAACVGGVASPNDTVDGSSPLPTGTSTSDPSDGGPSADGSPASDGAGVDASPAGDILGTLTGSCGQIRAEIGKPTPSVFSNTLTFVSGEVFDRAFLSDGGDRILDTPNAGGSSIESEVMSFEILHYCEGAKLLKTEKEIVYEASTEGGPSTITDLLIEVDGKKVGVNPIRVYKPSNQPQPTEAEIKKSLEDKLNSIRGSSARVSAQDKWLKQVMHVYTVTQANADTVLRVLPTIEPVVRADTVVLVTRSAGGGFLYCGTARAPVGQECP